ncbi:MAG: NAD(P)/FAD-dependent oxidoreductase [Actinomycetota bacterium]
MTSAPASATAPSPSRRVSDPTSADAVLIGGGHNGLVAAAYLARSGLDTVVIEARSMVGGTAASEPFGGATVNICNCDHLTFRTTPVVEELGLEGHGLRYVDVEPAQINRLWDGGGTTAWSVHHDLDRTLDEIGAIDAAAAQAYGRYARAAAPAVRMVFEAAAEPPTLSGLTRLAVRRRLAGLRTLFGWSRRSAADVLESFFADDLVSAPAAVMGPMVWGISPRTPGSGLGALALAMRHVGTVGRPIGGSGAVTEALRKSLESAGGVVRTSSRVTRIRCDADRVVGVTLHDGTEIDAGIVVSACNPHDTFLQWLHEPPQVARDLVRRWEATPHHDGYESKLDLVVDREPTWRDDDRSMGPTTVVAPSMDDIDRAARIMADGEVLEQPALLVNVPTLLDPTMAPEGRHVVSIEALFTPYARPGGWADGVEAERWLDLFDGLCEPGFRDSIIEWRAVTPDRYESDFHLPAGHATSFAGGPLAALRNPNPELTAYETVVPGLYLTGAATFPGAGVWGASGRNCASVVVARHA